MFLSLCHIVLPRSYDHSFFSRPVPTLPGAQNMWNSPWKIDAEWTYHYVCSYVQTQCCSLIIIQNEKFIFHVGDLDLLSLGWTYICSILMVLPMWTLLSLLIPNDSGESKAIVSSPSFQKTVFFKSTVEYCGVHNFLPAFWHLSSVVSLI